MYEMCVCYIIKQGVYFLFSLPLLFSLFPLLRYVCLDKCIRSFHFFSLVVAVVVCNNMENTAADGQHALASVHSFKRRGGTHAHLIGQREHKKKKRRETLI